ncbi:MAG TPA: alkaline phosphatase family protein [Chthoniobacterales bacterium]|jgi:phospholipase C|nr:alkaline phosphatase family protein [Chthoniobacterales bacterium]
MRNFCLFFRGWGYPLGLMSIFALRAVAQDPPPVPAPDAAGFEHVVVVMMENRSFDHFFGWLPNANGQQADLNYKDSLGASHMTHALAPDYQGCGFKDPGHSYTQGRVQYNGGACDGFLLNGSGNDVYAIGYYGQSDLAFLAPAATTFTILDNYFCGIMAETYPNRFYMHAAQTDRLTNTTVTSTLPTIWDRLQEKGLSGRYYFNNLPFLALWGSKYANISKPFADFLADAAAGTLPNVAYVDPDFAGELTDTSNDDHPHGDIRDGEAFLNQIYDAVRNSPNWSKTILIINFDEWGGFFDHVPPPLAEIPPATSAAGDNDGRLGFRVPCVVISPYAQRNFVGHRQYDHTSVLKMIEWRFGLPSLTVRDSTANNLAEVLNFAAPNVTAPQFNVPTGPFGKNCSLPVGPQITLNSKLRALAIKSGFKGVR